MKNIAIIDLGSSAVKLNVYKLPSKKAVYKESKTVNMAKNFYPTQVISDLAIKRVIKALNEFNTTLLAIKNVEIKLVTTGVARKAKNLLDLSGIIKNEIDWDLDVISAEDEADIFYKGVVYDFDPKLKLCAINIGVGGTEISFGDNKKAKIIKSFPIGISGMNEMFLRNDPPLESSVVKLMNYVDTELEEYGLSKKKADIVIYTGGELDYMKKTNHPLTTSIYSPSHPKEISLDLFKRKFQEIKSMKKEDLYKFMPENPKWMDGVVSCSAIAIVIAEKLGVNIIVPSNKNLNDGLLLLYKF